MRLQITEKAATWLKQELDLHEGDSLRFYTMLYGNSYSIHSNYSLGIAKEEPHRAAIRTEVSGIHFYVEEQDAWYLADHQLVVDVEDDEIKYHFLPAPE